MRVNPLQSPMLAPARALPVVSRPAPEVEPQDQASISSPVPTKTASKPFPWLDMVRGFTVAAALVGGVLGAIGVASYSSSQQGAASAKLLSADKNLTLEQRQLATTEMAPMGENTLRWMGASGERIYLTETDDQVLELYQQQGKLTPLEPGTILAQGMKLQSALEQSRQQPGWQSLQQRRDSLAGRACQLRQQWIGEARPVSGGMGMIGLASNNPPPPELLELSQQQLKVQLELEQLQTKTIQQSGVDSQIVRPGMPPTFCRVTHESYGLGTR